MAEQHPITPPPELVEQWLKERYNALPAYAVNPSHAAFYIATQAAQWGADTELDACCAWIPEQTPWDADKLRAARRPKPPSLKEQSLALIDKIQGNTEAWDIRDLNLVRRALEQLDD